MQLVELTGNSLTVEQLDYIIDKQVQIKLSDEARSQVLKGRAGVRDMMSDPHKVIYGINTGFGNLYNKVISMDNRKLLQVNLIKSHAVGVGKPMPPEIARREMVLRVNTLAKGRSGVSIETLQKVIDAYNAGFVPYIPQQGTVGASGDLAPLAHLSLGLLGQGQACDMKNRTFRNAEDVLAKLHLQKVDLIQKEGLALINGTQFMSSVISEVIVLAQKLLESAIVITAFAVEIFGMDYNIFKKPTIETYRKINPDLALILQKVAHLLDQNGSTLHQHRIKHLNHSHHRLRHPYSILHSLESLCAVKRAFTFCKRLINQEINGATDNPLVFLAQDGFQKDQLISAGNFHGEYVAKASDFIGMALFNLGRFSQARCQRYVNDKNTKLPQFLVKDAGLNSGFMIAQYTTAALLSESKVLVKPASVDSISTSASQEDHVSMGGFAARKAKILLQNMAHILGIQLLLCLSAVDFIKEEQKQAQVQCSRHLAKIKEKIREKISFMEVDRFFGPDINMAHDFVLGNLRKLTE